MMPVALWWPVSFQASVPGRRFSCPTQRALGPSLPGQTAGARRRRVRVAAPVVVVVGSVVVVVGPVVGAVAGAVAGGGRRERWAAVAWGPQPPARRARPTSAAMPALRDRGRRGREGTAGDGT